MNSHISPPLQASKQRMALSRGSQKTLAALVDGAVQHVSPLATRGLVAHHSGGGGAACGIMVCKAKVGLPAQGQGVISHGLQCILCSHTDALPYDNMYTWARARVCTRPVKTASKLLVVSTVSAVQ